MRNRQISTWNRESGYVYTVLGSAVGFGNILSFSGHCYRNGGGAFLIPYVIAMLLMGVPLFLLEAYLGKHYKLPFVSCFGHLQGPKWRFFGWMAVLACLTIGAFYVVITGYASAYTLFAAFGKIPENSELFFKEQFLHVSNGLTDWGGFSFKVFFWVVCIALLTWWVLARDIKIGLERFCSFFLPLLYTLLLLFVLLVFVLPGSFEGVVQLLRPDYEKLYDPLLWRDVFGQIFFSLSLGMGIVTALSCYTKKEVHLPRAITLVVMGDLFVSILASVAIYGCLGFLSNARGISIEELIHIDSIYELGFVIFPKIMHTLGGELSQFIGFVFFFSLLIAGATGVFSIVENVASNLEEEFALPRKNALLLVLSIIVLLAVPFCMGNGIYLMQALNPMLLGDVMLFGGIAEIVIFLYLNKEVMESPFWKTGGAYRWAYHSLRTLSLAGLVMGLGGAVAAEIKSGFSYPEMIRFGWFFVSCMVAFILSRKSQHKSYSV